MDDAVSEYSTPHLQALCFSTLFPYGRGSLVTGRDHVTNLPSTKYYQHLMNYYDKRFLLSQFVFWSLNITQRRQISNDGGKENG
jgi:hypothetical protein